MEILRKFLPTEPISDTYSHHQVKVFLCKSIAYNFSGLGNIRKIVNIAFGRSSSYCKTIAITVLILRDEVFKDMIESGYLPEGAVQLVCGEPGNILDFVKDGDSVVLQVPQILVES